MIPSSVTWKANTCCFVRAYTFMCIMYVYLHTNIHIACEHTHMFRYSLGLQLILVWNNIFYIVHSERVFN